MNTYCLEPLILYDSMTVISVTLYVLTRFSIMSLLKYPQENHLFRLLSVPMEDKL